MNMHLIDLNEVQIPVHIIDDLEIYLALFQSW